MRIRGREKLLRQYAMYREEGRIIELPSKKKGHWHEFFGNDNPIFIEIGVGRGRFISTHAFLNPQINYVGIELEHELLGKVGAKAETIGAGKNLVVSAADARRLSDIFEAGEVDRVYLNFSDPWPKVKHAKRRLTYVDFLESYRTVLKPEGAVHFKTDNKELFESSLNSFSDNDWKLQRITFDLHNSPWVEGNIMTEYEEKFSSQGMPIYRLEALPYPKRVR